MRIIGMGRLKYNWRPSTTVHFKLGGIQNREHRKVGFRSTDNSFGRLTWRYQSDCDTPSNVR